MRAPLGLKLLISTRLGASYYNKYELNLQNNDELELSQKRLKQRMHKLQRYEFFDIKEMIINKFSWSI